MFSKDCRATVVRHSHDIRTNVVKISHCKFAKISRQQVCDTRTTVLRNILAKKFAQNFKTHGNSNDTRATLVRKSCESPRQNSHASRVKFACQSRTLARHSCECRAIVVRIFMRRTSSKLVVKVLNMFKNLMRFFSPKYFASVARLLCDVRASVAFLSPRNFGEFTMRNFRDEFRTNVVRVSHDGRATVLRKHVNTSRLSGQKVKLSDIRTNVVRHSHECHATVVRMKMKINCIRGKVGDTLANVARLTCDSREIYYQS